MHRNERHTDRRALKRRKHWLKPWVVSVVAPFVAYSLAHIVAREALRRQGWFESWQFTTQGDRELGYRLRAGVSNHFGGAAVCINEDGLRTVAFARPIADKRVGELRVLTLGDSNTFGVSLPIEQTYPSLLERALVKSESRPVRVINLGAPGYSLLQSALALKRRAGLSPDIVVLSVNSANDRIFIGRSDSAQALAGDFLARSYEWGTFINYPLLYWSKSRDQSLALMRSPPSLSDPPPVPRVSRAAYREMFLQIIEQVRSQSAHLVLISTGESADSVWMQAGLVAEREHRLDEALSAFERAEAEHPALFLPAYHAYQCAMAAGNVARAEEIETRYRAAYALVSDHYIDNLAYASEEYDAEVRELSDSLGVPWINLRALFQSERISFHQGHFDAAGHRLVAGALVRLIKGSALSLDSARVPTGVK